MKVKQFHINAVLLIIMAFALSSCQNDGHIGWLFGSWKVEEYKLDGVAQHDALIDATVFSFQNNVVQVNAVTDNYGSNITRFGTWKENGSEFTLDFANSDDQRPSGTDLYSAPEWLGMESTLMRMNIQHSSGRFTLTWEDSKGQVKTYIFKKIV